MNYYGGFDVSLDTVSVCSVDGAGKVVREQEVSSTLKRSMDFSWEQDEPSRRLGLKAAI